MVFVTAELSTHWQGDKETLESLVSSCKNIGVDAVKFQALSKEKLSRHPEIPYYSSASITPNNIDLVDSVCKNYNLEWYASVFYPEAIEFLDPYVNRYKISVSGSKDNEIKNKVFSTGKKVIISTQKPFKTDDERIKNLYCIPNYPTSYGEINFNIIRHFDGYSNHCPNPMAILTALEYGAKYIEFHLTPSKDFFLVDNVVSFSITEAFDIIRWIRYFEVWGNRTSEINRNKISE